MGLKICSRIASPSVQTGSKDGSDFSLNTILVTGRSGIQNEMFVNAFEKYMASKDPTTEPKVSQSKKPSTEVSEEPSTSSVRANEPSTSSSFKPMWRQKRKRVSIPNYRDVHFIIMCGVDTHEQFAYMFSELQDVRHFRAICVVVDEDADEPVTSLARILEITYLYLTKESSSNVFCIIPQSFLQFRTTEQEENIIIDDLIAERVEELGLPVTKAYKVDFTTDAEQSNRDDLTDASLKYQWTNNYEACLELLNRALLLPKIEVKNIFVMMKSIAVAKMLGEELKYFWKAIQALQKREKEAMTKLHLALHEETSINNAYEKSCIKEIKTDKVRLNGERFVCRKDGCNKANVMTAKESCYICDRPSIEVMNRLYVDGKCKVCGCKWSEHEYTQYEYLTETLVSYDDSLGEALKAKVKKVKSANRELMTIVAQVVDMNGKHTRWRKSRDLIIRYIRGQTLCQNVLSQLEKAFGQGLSLSISGQQERRVTNQHLLSLVSNLKQESFRDEKLHAEICSLENFIESK